jgi:hypothetical protein
VYTQRRKYSVKNSSFIFFPSLQGLFEKLFFCCLDFFYFWGNFDFVLIFLLFRGLTRGVLGLGGLFEVYGEASEGLQGQSEVEEEEEVQVVVIPES